jgi:hypothetical protein
MGLDPAARLFRLLRNPARLLMLLELYRAGEAHATARARAAGHNLPSACNNLRLLCHAGVVERRAEGQRQIYRLASEEVRYILDWCVRAARENGRGCQRRSGSEPLSRPG